MIDREGGENKSGYVQRNLKRVKVLNTTAISSGYAGRDPQGGTSDGAFLASSLLGYKEWLKIFF